jgi:S1-C subfamily serine protease
MTAWTLGTSNIRSILPGFHRVSALTRVLACAVVVATLPVSGAMARAGISADEEDEIAAATFLIMVRILEHDDGDSSVYADRPLGTGVLVSSDGLVITNEHVVNLDALEAELDDAENLNGVDLEIAEHFTILAVDDTGDTPSREFSAELVDSEPGLDLALLRIVGDEHGRELRRPLEEDRHPVTVRDEPARDRENVTIFGYPDFGDDDADAFENITIDVVPAQIRRLALDPDVGGVATIHLNATVSRGSSGGPVIDEDGLLIGIVSEVHAGASGGSEAVAIPIHRAMDLLEDAGWEPPEPPTEAPDPTEASTERPDPTAIPTERPDPTAIPTEAPTLTPPQKDGPDEPSSETAGTSLVIMYDVSASANPSLPYHVRVWIDGDTVEYGNIHSVTWFLHPTFSPSSVYVDTSANGFLLEFDSWGEFEIGAEIHFWDGSILTLTGWLDYG